MMRDLLEACVPGPDVIKGFQLASRLIRSTINHLFSFRNIDDDGFCIPFLVARFRAVFSDFIGRLHLEDRNYCSFPPKQLLSQGVQYHTCIHRSGNRIARFENSALSLPT